MFWIRAALWTLFSCALPVAFIGWRFRIFSKISTFSLTGWGLIGIIIISVFLLTVIRYVKRGLPYSFFTQVLNGVCKVILPLVTLYMMLHVIQNSIAMFMQVLGCVILCEMAAIPMNPFPEWIHNAEFDRNKGKFREFVSIVLDAEGKKGE